MISLCPNPILQDSSQILRPSIVDKIKQNKFITDKDIQDIETEELNKRFKKEGRNEVPEYWKVKPISVEAKSDVVYKSSDNIKTEKGANPTQLKKQQQHNMFKKYVDETTDQ